MTNESLLRRLRLQMNIVVIHAISTGHVLTRISVFGSVFLLRVIMLRVMIDQ